MKHTNCPRCGTKLIKPEGVYSIIVRDHQGKKLQKLVMLLKSPKEALEFLTGDAYGEYDKSEVRITTRRLRNYIAD